VDAAGIAQADDARELHYLLAAGGPVAGTPIVAAAAGGFPVPPWLGDTPSSAWITPSTNTQAAGSTAGTAVYRYETTFDLTGFDPSTVVISGFWATDNGGVDILINGTSTGQPNVAEFAAWTPFHIRSGFVSGVNRLTFLVSNGEGEANPFGPTGLRVELCGAGTPLVPPLTIARLGQTVLLRWHGPGYMLQMANVITGTWSDFNSGTSADGLTFEVSLAPTASTRFFRLRP
jgi:hypothetical protein